jgi:Protein of unknown function DUF72
LAFFNHSWHTGSLGHGRYYSAFDSGAGPGNNSFNGGQHSATSSNNINVVKLNRLRFYIGCSGWSYTAWQGPFYPHSTETSAWLPYYSHVFDYVEIDSSFYKTPNIFMVNNWNNKTPKDFRFTVKFPKVITHDKRLKGVDEELGLFFEVIGGLADKTLALLI